MQCNGCYSVANLCHKCYTSALAPKISHYENNEAKIEEIINKVDSLQNQQLYNLQNWSKFDELINKKMKLQKEIKERKKEIKMRRQRLQKKSIQMLQKEQYKKIMTQYLQKLKKEIIRQHNKIEDVKQGNSKQLKKNLKSKHNKLKDVSNGLLNQSDQSIIIKSLQIAETEEIQIKDIYGYNDFFLATKVQTVMLKKQAKITESLIQIIKRNQAALICLQKIIKFWVPFNQIRELKHVQLMEKTPNELNMELLGLFQGNLQYLSYRLGIAERPLLCLNKYLIKALIQPNKAKLKVQWNSNLNYLKSDYIRQIKQVQEIYQSSYLPPLSLYKSNSEDSDQTYQILE